MRIFTRIGFLFLAWLSVLAQSDILLDRGYLPDVDLNDIAKNESLYVAVGQNGLILSSTDAVHWEPRHVITFLDFINNAFRGVAWNGSIFLAAGDLGRVYTSADGLTWNEGFTPSFRPIQAVIWNGSNFIAVGERISTSSNGVDWVEQDPQMQLADVACMGGLCIAIGESGAVFKSTDDVNWTQQTPFTSEDLVAIDILGSTFIAASLGNEVFTSSDGTNWTMAHVLASKPEALDVADGRAVILQEGGNLVSSTDTTIWVPGTSGLPEGVTSFLWDGMRYVGVGKKGHLIYGQSLKEWSSRLRDEVLPPYGGSRRGPVFINDSNQGLWTSGCARSWRRQANPVPDLIRSVAKLGEGFIAAGNNGTLITSPDGYNWTPIPFVNNQTIYTITVGDTSMVAHGESTYSRPIAGGDWQLVDLENWQLFRSIWDGQGFLGIGGLATKFTSTDGFTWQRTGGGGIIDNLNFLVEGVNNAVIYSYFESFNHISFGILKNSTGISSGSLPPYTWGWRWMDDHFLAVGHAAFMVDEQAKQTELNHPWGIWLRKPIVSEGRAYIPFENTNFEYIFDDQSCECPIYKEPENTVACLGSKAQLTVYADQPASYQWRKEGVAIAGATEATLTIPSFGVPDVGAYDCVVQTACITVTSARVMLEEGPSVEIREVEPSTSIFGESLLAASFSCDPGGLSWYWRDVANNLAFGFNQQTVRVPPAESERIVEVVVSAPVLLGTARDRLMVYSIDPMWIDPNGDGCQDTDDWLFLLPMWGTLFAEQDDPNRDGIFDIRDFLFIPANGAGCPN